MSEGLEGVIAARTVLSDVDGAGGRLVIRGHALEEIAGRATFAEIARALFEGFFAGLPDEVEFASLLGWARAEVFGEMGGIDAALLSLTPMEALRALVARLPDGDDFDTALRLLAAPAVFTPALERVLRGERPLAPDPLMSHAADVLRMTRGTLASPAEAEALDAYWVTVCDHGLNASTFAARVVASTRAGLVSAAVAALGALKGPLHGGAPGPVIEMLDEIGDSSQARAWLEAALDRGDRLMGFGHRIYRVRDPRADALKKAIRALDPRSGRLVLAEAVESAALAILRERKPKRPLETNVEFYTALLLEVLGFRPEAFTCLFAMGRMAGWIAHAREQIKKAA